MEHNPEGSHYLLQTRNVTGRGIDLEGALRFLPERNPDIYSVSRGDILLQSRGNESKVYLIENGLTNVLASSVFHILRADTRVVCAGYLAWWLNQPESQAQINAGLRGTGIRYISRQYMEQIAVQLPPLDLQHRIAQTVALWQRRVALQSQLDARRFRMIQTLCRDAVQAEKE